MQRAFRLPVNWGMRSNKKMSGNKIIHERKKQAKEKKNDLEARMHALNSCDDDDDDDRDASFSTVV